MANTITIGRLTFTSPASLSDSRSGSQHTMNINGVLAPDTLNEAKYLRDELLACANGYYVVPFIWQGDTSVSGYVKVLGASVNTSRVISGGYQYSIELEFLGNMGEVEFESQFSGGLIQNDHSVTSTTSQFYAPPVDSFSHEHTSLPSTFARAGEDGTIYLRTSSSLKNANAKFLCDPANYYKNACEVFTDGIDDVNRIRCGMESPNNSPSSTKIQNGLVQMTFVNNTAQSRFIVKSYDGSDYLSSTEFAVSRGASATEWQGWRSVQILKNDPEICTVRLGSYYEATTKDKRLTFDVSLRRGARHFSIVATQFSSAQFNIRPTSTTAYTDSTSFSRATNNDAAGNRIVLGSPQNFDVDTSNGGINSTANTATLKAFLGYEFNGSSATGEDQAIKIRDQYLDNIFEVVRLVKS
tara:strand:+ start:575 stop:1810 length:1236 start_codon:yes stop_codon:yes gene_type:complete